MRAGQAHLSTGACPEAAPPPSGTTREVPAIRPPGAMAVTAEEEPPGMASSEATPAGLHAKAVTAPPVVLLPLPAIMGAAAFEIPVTDDKFPPVWFAWRAAVVLSPSVLIFQSITRLTPLTVTVAATHP